MLKVIQVYQHPQRTARCCFIDMKIITPYGEVSGIKSSQNCKIIQVTFIDYSIQVSFSINFRNRSCKTAVA